MVKDLAPCLIIIAMWPLFFFFSFSSQVTWMYNYIGPLMHMCS